ncbi:MAG TPA: hypothetical protein VGO24_06865 [Solirubrobacterales bacterium]|nr:hypothetical protein [Solirubrobacterales bacterium]
MNVDDRSETVGALSRKRYAHLLCALIASAVLGAVAFTGAAAAAPGAYKVLIVYVESLPPLALQQQIAAEPGVASVELLQAGKSSGGETPTAAKLAPYDLVVDVPNNEYLDPVAYGNALADFIDSGGVLVQFAYDSWERSSGEPNGPAGRFLSGGYAPFLFGENFNNNLTLGNFDAASPLMQGVGLLVSVDNTAPPLAPGATLVAQWSDASNAIAYKGSVVSVTAYTGGEEIAGSGAYGRLAVNAVRWLGRQTLTVGNANPIGGTVLSSAGGISCGAVCSAIFKHTAPVTLTAVPNKGYAFAGFSGGCVGAACNLTMDTAKSVSANFYEFGGRKKVKLNRKKGTATFSFGVGGPGAVVLTGKKAKRRTKSAAKAGKVSLPIVPRGKALKALLANGKAKVGITVTFTPSGGLPASFTKNVTLRLKTD